MVKVQKPIPKTIKNGGPEFKKPKVKKLKTKPEKDVAKKLKKTMQDVVKNEAKDVKPIKDVNKKSKMVEKLKQTVTKKKPIVAQVQKSLKNGISKKKPHAEEELESVEKVIAKKKKTVVAKVQQSVKENAGVGNSIKEEVGKAVKSVGQKKKVAETKTQQPIKNTVAKKRSALEKDSETVKKVNTKKQHLEDSVQQSFINSVAKKKYVLKKNWEDGENLPANEGPALEKKAKKSLPKNHHLEANVQQSFKTTVSKKISTLKEESEMVKNVTVNKKAIKEKVQKSEVSRPVKKIQEKNFVVAKEQEPVKKAQSKLDTARKAEQKNLAAKVQKKISAEKKNKNKLKNKVKKNIGQIKKDLQKDKKENKKSETSGLPLYESENFDEGKFKDIVTLKNIKKICKAFKSLLEKEVEEKKNLVFKDYTYFMNIGSYKIPNCPKRMVKLNLKHSVVDIKVDDVALIVPDLQRGSKVDYEPTIQHYDDLLRENGVENITILPFNKLRNECSSFEAKRKLSNTYDYFLCDGRIVSHVVGFCGKPFQKPRTTIHAVRLENPKNLKGVIERSLKRTAFRQLQKGDLISIPVGSHLLTTDQVAENIEKVIEQMKTLFPGGYANMRNIHIRADIKGTSALPIYVSLSGAPEEVPNVVGPREQKMLKLKKEANEILSKFSMSKSGEFVMLNKAQVERKQKIREAREALTKENGDKNESELNSLTNKLVTAKNTNIEDDGVNEEGEEASEDGSEERDGDGTEEASEENSDINDNEESSAEEIGEDSDEDDDEDENSEEIEEDSDDEEEE